MILYSTAHNAPKVSFREAVAAGLAPDGGLYMPESLPVLPVAFWQSLRGLPVHKIAAKLLKELLREEFDDKFIDDLCKEAFNFNVPVVPLTNRAAVMELFHGPTLAFKDFGARFMARVMPECKTSENGRPLTILTATSGDTGAAVAQGFHGIEGIRVFVLYPKGKVSPLQERQFATLGDNITAVAVDGTFDDCQRMVKEAFSDATLSKEYNLTSANSINIARLLPQMVYYVATWSTLPPAIVFPGITFVVPSGNFGNLTAGLFAWKMGLPGVRFIAATNANDVVPAFLKTGEYKPRPSISTISNAMDVGNPSNFDRLLALFDGDSSKIRGFMLGEGVDDATTRTVIKKVFDRHHYLVDPHTATGLEVWNNLHQEEQYANSYGIILATAHPAKFIETMEEVVPGATIIPERLAKLADKTVLSVSISADVAPLVELIRN
jgi:threonine synthase